MLMQNTLLENHSAFSDEFFQQYPLTLGEARLVLPNGGERQYFFPTYFDQVKMSAAMFTCDYQAARKAITDPKLKPVSILPGRSMVIFVSYHYGVIHQMPAYNEILVMIPVVYDFPAVPFLPALSSRYPGAGYYIIALPMDSLENQLRGQQFWGLPKRHHQISNNQVGDHRVTDVVSDGKQVFRLTIPTTGSARSFTQTARVYSHLGSDLIQFRSVYTGNIRSQWLLNKQNHQAGLVLGEGKIANQLNDLQIPHRPFMVRSCDHLKSCLFLPEN